MSNPVFDHPILNSLYEAPSHHWETINAIRRSGSKTFSRSFLICAPGLTIKDRLRVLQPHDPDIAEKAA
jgi:hypothetical protein